MLREAMLGVTRGVWGRVAAGGDLQAMNAAAEKTGGQRKYLRAGEPIDLPGIDAVAIAAVRARLLVLQDRWRGFVPKGAITLAWPSLSEP